ncbi:hypothetical protein [Oleiagrimonas sp. MCCC 1A03011]|jgi:hypothetical protein|uniref:hypothetical protein n=1 Tax=Oleiagrimonas sp. MCCC 1A03011 TaxID=1926883 RepID=UPI0011BE5153|nr:hypothetical protein [Oleiagrimonas sp. MCCC 1A03011]
MKMHEIEIDSEVFEYLKAKAEPFVDTPNAVLRRELLGGKPGRKPEVPNNNHRGSAMPELSSKAPQALRQIIEVAALVLKDGLARPEATSVVARRHAVAQQTVLDKYCRQLNLSAGEFDALLGEPGLKKLRGVLQKKFPQWSQTIEDALTTIV